MSRKRRNHSPDFKAKVALAAIKGDETLSELAQRFGINANLIVFVCNTHSASAFFIGCRPDPLQIIALRSDKQP